MTAPKWAMERGRKLAALIGFHPSGVEFAFRIANNLAAAHREGWQAAIEAAVQICDTYADVNIEAACDTVLHDPVMSGRDLSPEGFEKSRDLTIEGCVHSSMYHAAKNIAEAVRALPYQPPEDRGDG